MNSSPRDWDAETYDEVSVPQFAWGVGGAGRLELSGDETVLDAGCGSGRVTEELPSGCPRAPDRGRRLRGDDRQGAGAAGSGRTYLVADLSELEVDRAGRPDLLDRDLPLDPRPRPPLRTPARGAGAGRPAGGAVRRSRATSPSTRRSIAAVAARPEFAPHLEGMTAIWNFAAPEETERAAACGGLRRRPLLARAEAGHARSIRSSSPPPSTLGPHLAQLPEELRRPFAEAVLERRQKPLTPRLRPPQHRGDASAAGDRRHV